VSLIHRQAISIDQAIEAAKDYIEACKDPEARKIDETACKEIAGHFHVATIKPTEGFDCGVVDQYQPPKVRRLFCG
jgi:hypothetical protein